jgi:hypothetical protein
MIAKIQQTILFSKKMQGFLTLLIFICNNCGFYGIFVLPLQAESFF